MAASVEQDEAAEAKLRQMLAHAHGRMQGLLRLLEAVSAEVEDEGF